MLPPSAEE